MSSSSARAPRAAQLGPAGIAIGVVGCVIITASSVYTALKMGSLPWPTIFTSITALVLLRAVGRRSLNEANITQVIMSAGSMVAGGLAFTVPGIWMLGFADSVSIVELLAVALAGTLLGLVCTALIRRRFVDESDLEYPIGTAAAETLQASDAGGATGRRLFISMGVAGVWVLLRDAVGALPAMLAALPIPGVAFGVFNSPMMLSVGFLMGTTAIAAQLIGGVLANFGIIVGGTAAGLFDLDAATGIVKSLGMGLMMGSGLGVVVKDVLPHARAWFAPSGDGAATDIETRTDAGALALMAALAALIVSVGLGLGPVVAVIMVLLSFVTTVMSAQSVGQTGIDPMEIFGLIVLLIVAAVTDTQTVGLFLVAGVVAVACGLAGDVMSDFKTGAIIGTNPRAMWAGQAIGALIGSVVAAVTLAALASAYGVDAFGPGKLFVSAQASVVATMVSGIPSVPAFAVGVAAGIVLYLVGLPAMMLGLGVYLPFYMTLSMAFGAVAKFIWDRVMRARGLSAQESGERGVVIASGLLGGESIVGVLIALVSVVMGMLG